MITINFEVIVIFLQDFCFLIQNLEGLILNAVGENVTLSCALLLPKDKAKAEFIALRGFWPPPHFRSSGTVELVSNSFYYDVTLLIKSVSGR